MTTYRANKNYYDANAEAGKEQAIKLAAAAHGDTKRFTMTPEERDRLAREAAAAANAPRLNLAPQTVEQKAAAKVTNMAEQAARDLNEVFPAGVRFKSTTDRTATNVPGEPHCSVTQVGYIQVSKDCSIAIHVGNFRGQVTLDSKTGKPTFGTIIPSTEATQSQPVYFAVVANRGPDGKPDISPQALFRLSDINDVAAQCCKLIRAPEPTKKIERNADKNAENVASAKPTASAKPPAPQPAHKANARALWSRPTQELRPDMTIIERRAMQANMQRQEPERPRAFAMG